MAAKKNIVIGSRGSQLALWQATHVKNIIEKHDVSLKITIKVIKTTGDRIQNKPLFEFGGKSLFLKELEEALRTKEIDLAVHSMKDVPADLHSDFQIAAILKREDPRDSFVSKKYDSLLHLPKKAKVGTSSLRRQAQIKNFRPDFEVIPLRGNLETRLRKLGTQNLSAIILAAAGLTRLGMTKRITEYLPTTLMLPGVGQGAIGVETRAGDAEIMRLVDFLNDPETVTCLTAERSFLKALGGDCRAPIAGYAEINGMTLKLTGMVATPDGRDLIRDRVEGNFREAVSLGEALAKSLFSQGGREILRSSANYLKK
ncbi:MAG: hydroxymethylbilane synthase [Deltaproteobacteria bacterium]|nr:hydroxymethylbilane synthase [Deltaproteobacteria bacterium]